MAIPDILRGNVLSIDTETAVLGDHVCEIGLSLFKNTELFNEWGILIKPIIPIDPGASEIHKIRDSDVVNSPSFKDIISVIYNNMNIADVLVIYNAEYDMEVLRKEFERADIKLPRKPVVDPFIFFRHYHKYNKGKTLSKAAEKYGIQYIGAHRAVNDATVSGKVLFKIAAINTDFPKDLNVLLKRQRKLAYDQYEDLNNYFISKGKGPIEKPKLEYYDGSY